MDDVQQDWEGHTHTWPDPLPSGVAEVSCPECGLIVAVDMLREG